MARTEMFAEPGYPKEGGLHYIEMRQQQDRLELRIAPRVDRDEAAQDTTHRAGCRPPNCHVRSDLRFHESH